jgi:predicted TIM-barrel fold metal-dependent hydrolase
MLTDFHTHVFPDALAKRAITALTENISGVEAHHDGRVMSLLASMDRAGIDRSVIASIATKPSQFEPILQWSSKIASPRLVPFASVHPLDPHRIQHIQKIRDAGLPGVKLHPYHQNFVLDDPELLPLFRAIAKAGLIVLCHTGFDIAFPRDRRCDPVRIRRILEQVPELRFVATHFGAWNDWDEVQRHLLGRPIWMEISFAFDLLPDEMFRNMLLDHPADRLLFGTDSPWNDQSDCIGRLRGLSLPASLEHAMLHDNPAQLLDGSITTGVHTAGPTCGRGRRTISTSPY